MSHRTKSGILLALVASVATITPVLAQYYVNPYRHPYYNHYLARGYAPCGAYGYCAPNHTVRNVAVGAAVGAAAGAVVGLLASHHGHRYL
jgi:hypothetical protein